MATYINVTVGESDLLDKDRQQRAAQRNIQQEARVTVEEGKVQRRKDKAKEEAKTGDPEDPTKVRGKKSDGLAYTRDPTAQRKGGRFGFIWFEWPQTVEYKSSTWLNEFGATQTGTYTKWSSGTYKYHYLDQELLSRAEMPYLTYPTFNLGSNVAEDLRYVPVEQFDLNGYVKLLDCPTPVVCVQGDVVYGVSRLTYEDVRSPWGGRFARPNATPPYNPDYFVSSPAGTTQYNYLTYFTGKVNGGQMRVKQVLYTAHNPQTPGVPLVPMPEFRTYWEGGSGWAKAYVDNAFPGDPSVAVRALGYSGEYRVKGNQATFTRVRTPDIAQPNGFTYANASQFLNNVSLDTMVLQSMTMKLPPGFTTQELKDELVFCQDTLNRHQRQFSDYQPFPNSRGTKEQLQLEQRAKYLTGLRQNGSIPGAWIYVLIKGQ